MPEEIIGRVMALDYETFYTTKYSVKKMIAEEYCRDDRFDAYLVSAVDTSGWEWVGHPRDFPWERVEGATLLSHNRYFDHNVSLELVRREIIPDKALRFAHWHCTANLTSYLCNCRALDNAVEFLYETSISKAARTEMRDKHWENLTPVQQEGMRVYALDDVRWCLKIWQDHSDKWPQIERELSDLTIDQGMRGIQIDTALLEDYLIWTYEALEKTKELIPWVDDGKAPSSPHAVAAECRKNGIPCPPIKSDDQDGFIEWEKTYAPIFPWVTAISSYRSLTKLFSTFQTMKRRLREDGTMPFALKYFGAHTGRWSGDANMNLQNPRKVSVLVNEQGLMEIDDDRVDAAIKEKKKTKDFPEWVQHEINFRYLLKARPGKKMITADLRQIEPRVLAWCAKDYDFLDGLRDNEGNFVSPYIVHARKTMDWPEERTKDDDPSGYNLAKIRVLGLGYGCGWKKFISLAALAGIDLTKDDPEEISQVDENGDEVFVSGYGYTSKKIVEEYRKSNPKIVDLWARLDSQLKNSVAEDLNINLPSWRRLSYRGVKIGFRTNPDPDRPGKTKTKRVWTADIGSKRTIFYGGLLTENLVQAISRDVFAYLTLKIHKAGHWCLFTCHDECILEVDPEVTADQIRAMMREPVPFLKRCPVDAEAKEVPHYIK